MVDDELTLPEQILLLVLKERDGSLLVSTHFRHALAGAVLTELLHRGSIELEDGTSAPLVTPVSEEPTGDPVLDPVLAELTGATRRTDPRRWIERFAEDEETPMRVARQLCRKGVLDEREGRVRLIFLRTVYMDLEPEVEEEVTERVRDAVFGDDEVDSRTALLTALAGAGGILRAVFGPEKVLERLERIRALGTHSTLTEGSPTEVTEDEAAIVSATDAAVLAVRGAAV